MSIHFKNTVIRCVVAFHSEFVFVRAIGKGDFTVVTG